MKTVLVRGFATLALVLFAHSSFADDNSGIKGSVISGIAKIKPLALTANANGVPLDIVVINYTQPQDNIVINQTLPIGATIGGQMSSRAYTENFLKGDYIEVKFTYNGSTFDRVVYRRSTIGVFKSGDPVVTEFRK